MTNIGRGLVAGAFGTLLLDAATYVDMALTGRPASDVPRVAVRRAAEAAGVDPPRGDARLEAYGALGGLATGLGVGVTASLARAAGVRLPAPWGAVAIGGLAMAATNGPMAGARISDPREWSTADWARDVVPHLAYGAGTRWAMDRIDRSGHPGGEPVHTPRREAPPRLGRITRSAALGVAAGAFVGSLVGAAWRDVAAERGWTWRAAVVEVAVGLGLTVAACR